MVTGILQRLTSVAFWGGLCTVFSFFVSAGGFLLGGFILVVLLGIICLMAGPQFIVATWMIGSPTFFGFPNEILRGFPFVTMERLALFALIAMVFMRYAFDKKQTPWLAVEKCILIFLAYTFLNLLAHTDAQSVRQDGWLWIQFMLPMSAFIVSRRIEWNDDRLKLLLAALALTGVFVAIAGILQSLFNVSIFTRNYQTITIGHSGRAYGPFSSAHTYVASLFIFLTVSLLQFSFYRDRFLRFLLIVAMGVMAVGIVLGVSRGPWIGAALAFVIIYFKHPPSRPLLLVGLFLAFLAGTGAAIVLVDHLGAIASRMFDIGSMQGRAAAWATSINMVSDHPLFGVGFGSTTYADNKAAYIIGIGSLSAQYADFHGVPHNQYLYVAVLAGLLGLILFLMILFGMARLMLRIYDSSDKSSLRGSLALYAGAIFIALMFNSIFSDTYLQDYFWVLAYFLAGIAAGNIDGSSVQRITNEHGGRAHDAGNG